MPHTTLGKWSVGLIVAFILLLVVFYVCVLSGQRGGQGFFDNLNLTIPALLAGACGVASFIVGLVAIITKRERSALVFIAVVIGALVTLWIAVELIFPH